MELRTQRNHRPTIATRKDCIARGLRFFVLWIITEMDRLQIIEWSAKSDNIQIAFYDGFPTVSLGYHSVIDFEFNDIDSAERFKQDLKHFVRVCRPLMLEYNELYRSIDFLWAYPMFAPHIETARQYATKRRAALQRAMDSIQVADGVVWLAPLMPDGDGAIRRRIVSFAALF